MALLFFLLIFGWILVFSCKRESENVLNEAIPLPGSASITSLNCGVGDTLLVGTEEGHLLYYQTKSKQFVKEAPVGKHSVYFACLIDNDNLFVGVSDEGLKKYSGDGKQLKEQYKLVGKDKNKGYNYSVYKVLHIGDTLLCATSNGLAMLDLDCPQHDTNLQLLFPDSIKPDFKIDQIMLSPDSLKVSVIVGENEFTFQRGKYDRAVPNKPIGGYPEANKLHFNSLTYSFHPKDNKFLVIPDTAVTGQPHNFVFVHSYYHNKQAAEKLFAIEEKTVDGISNSTTKNIFIGSINDGVHKSLAWTRSFRNVTEDRVAEMITLPDNSYLLLAMKGHDGEVYLGKHHKLSKLTFSGTKQRVRCMCYDKDWKRIYFALGAGYIYYNVDSIPYRNKKSSECIYYPSSSILCIEESANRLYLGTMRDGVIVIKKENPAKGDTLLPKRGIKSLQYDNDRQKLYALTNDTLFICDIEKDTVESVRNHLTIDKVFCKGMVLYGVTHTGQLLYLDDHKWNWLDREFVGKVNQDAVSANNHSIIGTDKGLFFENKDEKMVLIPVHDTFIKSHPLLFAAFVAVLVILLLCWILFQIKKTSKFSDLTNTVKNLQQNNCDKDTRISQLETEKNNTINVLKLQITDLTNTVENLRQPNDKTIVIIPKLNNEKEPTISDLTKHIKDLTSALGTIQLLLHNPFLKIDSTKFSTSTDSELNKWVSRNAHDYVMKKNSILNSKDNPQDCNDLFPYAFAMELYNLHNNWAKDMNLDHLHKEVERIKNTYLKKCLPLSDNARKNIRSYNQDCYLHLCILSLLSLKTEDGDRFITGNNKSITEYLVKCNSKSKPTNVAHDLREHIQNNDLFKKTEPYGELFDTLIGEFKTELKIKDLDMKPSRITAIKSVEQLSSTIEDSLKSGTNTRMKWCKELRRFYNKIFKMLFDEINTEENALQVWYAAIILKDRKDLQNEEELLKLVNVLLPEKEQKKEISEKWLQEIINSEIKPHPDYKDIFDNEWKDAAAWLKAITNQNISL